MRIRNLDPIQPPGGSGSRRQNRYKKSAENRNLKNLNICITILDLFLLIRKVTKANTKSQIVHVNFMVDFYFLDPDYYNVCGSTSLL